MYSLSNLQSVHACILLVWLQKLVHELAKHAGICKSKFRIMLHNYDDRFIENCCKLVKLLGMNISMSSVQDDATSIKKAYVDASCVLLLTSYRSFRRFGCSSTNVDNALVYSSVGIFLAISVITLVNTLQYLALIP